MSDSGSKNCKIIRVRETVIRLVCDPMFWDDALEEVIKCRREIESFIRRDPMFLLTLEPYDGSGSGIVQKMIDASRKFGVGPMAAVAGAISDSVLSRLLEKGASHAIVENGGDIAMRNDRRVLIGIYAGSSPIKNLAFEIDRMDDPLGICTSSGTVGHSLSFGCADAAVVIAENATIADAAATALGNEVKDCEMKDCFRILEPHPEVYGAMVIVGDKIATYGNLPRIVRAKIPDDLIGCKWFL